MKAIYNHAMIELADLRLSFDDRGFRYGDGLFETMAVIGQNVRFLKEHYQRISRGAALLQYNIDSLPFTTLEGHCRSLLQTAGTRKYGKMKLYVWRRGQGLYEPASDNINFLMFCEPSLMPAFQVIENIDISRKATNFFSSYSALKTISAMKYVVAGLEIQGRKLDEIIIKDHEGNISETLYSNIFVKCDGVYNTPPVSTGCVEGVMRGRLMEELNIRGYLISEKLFTIDELLIAESAFLTNALGIKHILKIGEKTFKTDMMIQRLIESWS